MAKEIEIKSSLLNSEEFEFVKRSIIHISEIDGKQEYRTNVIEYINDSSSSNDDEFFFDMLEFVRFLNPKSEHLAYTTPERLIYMNCPHKNVTNLKQWDFTFDHECLHQLWETFGVAEKIIKEYGSYNHELLNIASDCVINDYLVFYRKKEIPKDLITPEWIKTTFNVDYDRKNDTQYSLYCKLKKVTDEQKELLKKLMNDPAFKKMMDDENSNQSGQPSQSGQSGLPSQSGQSGQSGEGGESGESESENNGGNNDKSPSERAKEAADKAQKSADNAKSAANKSGDKDKKESADKAQDAADRAKDAAERAKECEKNGDMKGAEKAAKEAEEAAAEAEKNNENAGGEKVGNSKKQEGELTHGDKNHKDDASNNEGGGNGGGGTADYIETPAELEKIKKQAKEVLDKWREKISGDLGSFINKCKKSLQLNPSGLNIGNRHSAPGWNQQMASYVNTFVKKQVFKKKRYFEKTYSRMNRRAGYVKAGQPITPGRRTRKDALTINCAFYIDRSGSMMGDPIKNVFKAAYAIAEGLKKQFSREKIVDEISFKMFAFDTVMHPIKWGNTISAGGGNMDGSEIFEYIEKNTNDFLINIIITDAQFSFAESTIKELLDKTNGMVLFIANNDCESIKRVAKDSLHLFYVLADSQFTIKN